MKSRFAKVGYGLAVFGLAFLVAGGVAYFRVQDGYGSLQAFSEAQNVELSYNEDGQLIDRGTTEEADAIMALLVDDWNYPVVDGDMDPGDPLVNTGSEYMFQMATIAHHTLTGTQEVVLAEDVEYEGETFDAGTYEVAVDGRYSDRVRSDLIRSRVRLGSRRGPERCMVWSVSSGSGRSRIRPCRWASPSPAYWLVWV